MDAPCIDYVFKQYCPYNMHSVVFGVVSLWRHRMGTFSALLAICAGNSPVPGEFPTQRPVTRSFDVYFDLCPNERLSKHSWGWWLEMPPRPLWCHRNVCIGVWLLWLQKQASQAWISYYIPQNTAGCNYLSMPRVPGPRLNIKTVLSTYGDFHVKDKTVVRTSYL